MAVSAAPWIAAQREALAKQGGHALLLQGPSGLGQYSLALELVRTWLCEDPQPHGPCGQCAGCHAIDVRTHADLCVLMPETVMLDLGWPLPEKAQQEIDDKKRKASKEIRVDALRDAVEFAQRTSARGRGKVVLVYPAERMNPIAANTLLKTLEEPAGDVRFVLASEAAHQLLPTIRSRCLAHTLAWPEPEQALAWLQAQEVAPADAAVLLRAAGGRPEDALRWAQAGLTARHWSELPKALARGEAATLAEWSPAQAIDALQKVCHDLLSVAAGGTPRFFALADLPATMAPTGLQALATWWRELADALRTADHPFNSGLMMEALVSRARAVLHCAPPVSPRRP